MHDEQSKNMKLDDRLDSYHPFFDHEWAKELFQIAASATKLRNFVFDLTLSIKGLSRTAAIPLLAVDVAQSYSSGHQMERLENSLTLKVINHFAERLSQKIVLSGAEATEIRKVMLELADEACRKVQGQSVEFPRQELWDGMVKIVPGEEKSTPKNEFRLALWSCQRVCYSGLFFAYEDFVVRCLCAQSGKNVRATNGKFPDLCKQHFGSTLADSCWSDQDIEIARKVRNSLAHAGGRETDQLKSEPHHDLLVIDGILQILPSDVAELFTLLKPRIKALVEWAAPLPAFCKRLLGTTN